MILKIKKTYGSNFDLITAVKDGADKTFIKTVKRSDEVGEFEDNQDGWSSIAAAFDGLADCEFELSVDTDSPIYDNLGNVYFKVVE